MSNPETEKLDYLSAMDISLYMNIIEEEEKAKKAKAEAIKPSTDESDEDHEEQGKAS
jgi:hypothetical protein